MLIIKLYNVIKYFEILFFFNLKYIYKILCNNKIQILK